MQPITGQSLTDILYSSGSGGMINPERNYVLVGKERHDVGRPGDVGYPVRGIVKEGYLYLMNFKPDRWPAGNPETGYLNTDGSPTKTWILNDRRKHGRSQYWDWNFGKHPEEELYKIADDPDCVVNLASQSGYTEIKEQLKIELARKLEDQNDPRILGNGDVFDNYLYSNESDRNFYERYMSGEDAKAGWVNESDFEKEKLD
jgi:hypothetical protein